MAIEIVSFPIKNGDFPVRYVNVYQRVFANILVEHSAPQSNGVSHIPIR